jgi:hypothetical protein
MGLDAPPMEKEAKAGKGDTPCCINAALDGNKTAEYRMSNVEGRSQGREFVVLVEFVELGGS